MIVGLSIGIVAALPSATLLSAITSTVAKADGGAGGAGGGAAGGTGGTGGEGSVSIDGLPSGSGGGTIAGDGSNNASGGGGAGGGGAGQNGFGGGGGAAGGAFTRGGDGGNGGCGPTPPLCVSTGPNAENGGNGIAPGGIFAGQGGAGGGGGGGGGHGFVGTTLPSGPLTGGNGGAGGNGGDGGGGVSAGGGGGGGGAGGYGAVVTGATANTNSSTIQGGNGGAGGLGGLGTGGGANGQNGTAGDGGIGIKFSAFGATLTNTGTVAGGNGNVGGAGIVGGGLTIINSGGISGGNGGAANAITFTGGTNLLEIQSGSTITGNVVAFSAADTVRLGGAANASFNVSQIGVQYLNFGLLEKSGASTWTLTGTMTATTPWTINQGTLRVDGSIASSTLTTVNNGGTLAGIGTVGSTQINSGGAFAPGSGAAGSTMTVAGNLAFQSGALYLVQVNPATASSANVTGGANLTGGSVQTAFAPGSYGAQHSYVILHTAGGLGGTCFSGVSGNTPANFTQTVSCTSTDALLNLNAALGAGLSLNQNQQNVAGAINNFFNNGGNLPPGFVNLFGLTGGTLANQLALLTGEAATGAQRGASQLMGQFLGTMLDPFVDGRSGIGDAAGPARGFAPERAALPEEIALAYAKVTKTPVYKADPTAFERRWTAWGSAFGRVNKTDGDPIAVGSHDLRARAAGFAAGLDYRFSGDAVVGFALAGGGTRWDLAQGLGGGKSDAFQAGVYAAARSGPAYAAASLAFANHWMSTNRVAAFSDQLTADFDGQSIGGRIEAGYRFGTPAGGVAPYAALQAQSFRTPSYSETDITGGGFGLTYNGRTATDTRSELGARFDRVLLVDPRAVLTLRGRLAWAHDWVSDPSLVAVFQALPGASFVVTGASPAKDSALASAGAELQLANGVSLLGKFDGEFASHSKTYAGTGIVRFSW